MAFVGPFGVGKTTAVFTLCGTSVTSSEVHRSVLRTSVGRRIKPTTTVGLEVGHWTASDGRPVSIVGTPGQERFDTVRQSAMPRSTGVVLWLFGNHEFAITDARLWLDFISREVPVHKLTVAMTRLDAAPEGVDVSLFEAVVHDRLPGVPVVAADPRSRDDVAEVVRVSLRLPSGDAPDPTSDAMTGAPA